MMTQTTSCVPPIDIRGHLLHLDEVRLEGHYGRGDVVYSTKGQSDRIYIVESGRVELVYVSQVGREKIIAIYQAGDCFGELSIRGAELKGELRAVALEPTHTVSFSAENVLSLLHRRPEFALDLLYVLCARLAELQEEIATLAFLPIPQRVAKELLRLASSLAKGAERKAPEVAVILTHEELARLVGTSREVITAVMNQFRREGLVQYGRRNIVFSPVQLEEFLDHD